MYVAMWSLPGCIPEMEPAWFDTFEEARTFLYDSASMHADGDPSTDDWTEWYHILECLNDASDTPVIETAPDGYVYTITRE